MRYTYLILLLVLNHSLSAQLEDTIAYKTIEVNNIKFGIRADGLLFHDQATGNGAFIHQPTGINLLNGVGTWLGAIGPAGNFKNAVEYPNDDKNKDFSPGLLHQDGAPIVDFNCNKIWTVTREDIEHHLADYYDNGKIDYKIPAIFGWPGSRNPFFAEYHGENLPEHELNLAPFTDRNYNDIYEPDLGEIPAVFFFYNFWAYPTPDIIAWFAYNDGTVPHRLSNSEPLFLEAHATVFAYNCQEAGLLNNSVFVIREFFPKGIESVFDTYISSYQDFSLRCPNNYFGTLPELNTVYAYDAQHVPDNGCDKVETKALTPLVAVTSLSTALNANGNDDFYSIPVSIDHPDSLWSETGTHFPKTPLEFYHTSSNRWADGTPLSIDEDGYNPTEESPPHHLYDGRLLDSLNWTEVALKRPVGQRRTLLTEGPFTLNPGSQHRQTTVYTVHPILPNDTTHSQSIERIATDIDSLILAIENHFNYLPFNHLTQGGCTRNSTVSIEEHMELTNQLVIYPNPTVTNQVWISVPSTTNEEGELFIYNQLGQLVQQQYFAHWAKNNKISVADLATGIYWIVVRQQTQEWVGKLNILGN